MAKIFVLPDCQVKPGSDTTHLVAAGKYVVEKKPDIVVCLGDFADMPSLSSYDVGKKSFEGRKYMDDIDAAKAAMTLFLAPIRAEQKKLIENHKPRWNPRMILTLGNHEARIDRAINEDRKLEGLISISDLEYEQAGWEVYPFLEPITVEGITFCHYLVSGAMGRPIGSAAALISKKHQSCVVGHQQGKQIAYGSRADGSSITAMILGSFYTHNEEYMGPQGNKHWRGAAMLHEAKEGSFDEMLLSLDYLVNKYAGQLG